MSPMRKSARKRGTVVWKAYYIVLGGQPDAQAGQGFQVWQNKHMRKHQDAHLNLSEIQI